MGVGEFGVSSTRWRPCSPLLSACSSSTAAFMDLSAASWSTGWAEPNRSRWTSANSSRTETQRDMTSDNAGEVQLFIGRRIPDL